MDGGSRSPRGGLRGQSRGPGDTTRPWGQTPILFLFTWKFKNVLQICPFLLEVRSHVIYGHLKSFCSDCNSGRLTFFPQKLFRVQISSYAIQIHKLNSYKLK
jgi:hypothetical protein